jgi:hypothetical protein
VENLWPSDLGFGSGPKAPITILKEQAALLGNMTMNIVEAEIIVSSPDRYASHEGDFEHRFYLVAPALNGYLYLLFEITHSIEMYPVFFKISDNELYEQVRMAFRPNDRIIMGEIRAKDEAEFLEILKNIFNADKTRKIINAIFAQSRGLVDEQ